MQELFDHNEMDILSMHGNQIEILSSSLGIKELRSLNLHPCDQVANISHLIAAEMEWNWDEMQDHKAWNWNKEMMGLDGVGKEFETDDKKRFFRNADTFEQGSIPLPYQFNKYVSWLYLSIYIM